jgi:hypothetical protein
VVSEDEDEGVGKVWVVYLEPFDGGFVTTQVMDLGDNRIYASATPHVCVPSSADVKDEIGAYMYAQHILANLHLDRTKD